MIFLSPGIGSTGGIQVSAWEAWRAFADARDRRAIIFGQDDTGELAQGAEGPIVAQNRLSLAARIAARRWPDDCALFWHVGLLKLLPLLHGFRGRVVLFLHGIEVWRKPSWLTRFLLGRVNHFLSNSQTTWERFLEFVPACRSVRHTVVHLGLGEIDKGEAAVPDEAPATVMIGRLDGEEQYSKGHRELITTWPLVRRQVPGAQLWVVGDGSSRRELESLARSQGLVDAFRFCGRLSEDEKRALIVRARCLAMPSRGEGFGLVYLEAMRLGRPCLVSDCDAGREVVNPPESGLAVAPDNLPEVARALAALMTLDARWRQWSQAARCRYDGYFTATHFHERLRRAIGLDRNEFPSDAVSVEE